MLKLIIGVKGTGKTKVLIDMVNGALAVTKGDVVCIEKGAQLRFDIKPAVRLVNSDEYLINDASTLYGFIAGILASNNDITDIFVDSSLKICGNDVAAFESMLPKLEKISDNVNIVMSASIAVEEAPEGIKKYA